MMCHKATWCAYIFLVCHMCHDNSKCDIYAMTYTMIIHIIQGCLKVEDAQGHAPKVPLHGSWWVIMEPRWNNMHWRCHQMTWGASKWQGVQLNDTWCVSGLLMIPIQCLSRIMVPKADGWWVVIVWHLFWAYGLMVLAH